MIRRISLENPLWGAPRIHGELLKLGYDLCETTIAKYMVRRPGPPSQSWRTFIRNHMSDLAAIDFFTVHTAGFKTLYVFLILSLDRRRDPLQRHIKSDRQLDKLAADPSLSL